MCSKKTCFKSNLIFNLIFVVLDIIETMIKRISYVLVSMIFFIVTSCKNQNATEQLHNNSDNIIEYAKGFSIREYNDFSVVTIHQPWVNAKQSFSYVLHKDQVKLPDSLQKYPSIQIPIKEIVCTSTTHLPALEILNEISALKGFAGLNYVSSEQVTKFIAEGKVKEVGENESLNVEKIIDLQPNVLIAFAMDSENKALQTITNAGIPVIYNGDWIEQNPLGKAEWIKLFGLLFDKKQEAFSFFDKVVADYNTTLTLVKNVKNKPTVLSGVMYSDVWYLPEGNSWASVYFDNAQADYLWKNTKGVGSLALSFEKVFEKAQDADFWINPGHYESLSDLEKANPHYKQFSAFKHKKIYSMALTKGANGGTVFYELGPLRPDVVLKDLIKIFHPELLPNYKPFFYKQLQ